MIHNLTIKRPSLHYVGLFGKVSSSGVIRNVGLQGGSVTGGYSVGSLVGKNDGPINNAYTTGAVTGTGNDHGGLVGANSGTIISSYWDTQTTGQSTSAGGTALTTAQMHVPSNFTGFDWTIWAPADSTHRPELYGVSGVIGYTASMVYGSNLTSAHLSSLGDTEIWNKIKWHT